MWNAQEMSQDACFTSLKRHFRSKDVCYKGVRLRFTPSPHGVAEWAGIAGSVDNGSWSNSWVRAIYLIELLGHFPHWGLYIFLWNKKKPLFEQTSK